MKRGDGEGGKGMAKRGREWKSGEGNREESGSRVNREDEGNGMERKGKEEEGLKRGGGQVRKYILQSKSNLLFYGELLSHGCNNTFTQKMTAAYFVFVAIINESHASYMPWL